MAYVLPVIRASPHFVNLEFGASTTPSPMVFSGILENGTRLSAALLMQAFLLDTRDDNNVSWFDRLIAMRLIFLKILCTLIRGTRRAIGNATKGRTEGLPRIAAKSGRGGGLYVKEC